MATDDATDSSEDAVAGEGADGGDADAARSKGWLAAVAAAARWALDVFRGHARSRHLNNREK